MAFSPCRATSTTWPSVSPAPRSVTVIQEWPDAGVRRRFAASAAGAQERVAQGGAHPLMRDSAAPGPLTQASAPQAPGRLGPEDARTPGGGALNDANPCSSELRARSVP